MIQFPRSALPGVSFGAWCNGSTTDFESVDPGSNPGAPSAYYLTVNEDEPLSTKTPYRPRASLVLLPGNAALAVFISPNKRVVL